jgi:Outer membrane protein beta-barrel domain
MKHLLLLFALSFTFSAFSQNNKFKFGVVFNPSWSDNVSTNDGTVPRAVEESFKKLERKTLVFYGYPFVQYALSTRANLRVGIGYAISGYSTARTKYVFGTPEPSAPEYGKFYYYYKDIILPTLFKYNFSKRKNTVYVIAGPTLQFNLNRITKAVFEYADGSIKISKMDDYSTAFRKVNVNATIGIGYDLKIAKKAIVFFQPTFDCNLLGTSNSASLNRKIYSIGINIGLIFG